MFKAVLIKTISDREQAHTLLRTEIAFYKELINDFNVSSALGRFFYFAR